MSDYLSAERCCDLVMKGGITSGILYPPAICKIAEDFHLVGIGGTSAGAIAACTAAAAEYRRRQFNDGSGFDMLRQLPIELGEPGKLLGLFRPDQATRKLHKLMLEAMDLKNRSWFAKKRIRLKLLWTLMRRNKKLRPWVDNGFGLCSGMACGNLPDASDIAPLTEWLAETIDRIAGKDNAQPLTFGDLRHAKIPAKLADTLVGMEKRSIDLRAVTTCITFGRPYELPLDEGGKIFAFDEAVWRTLFPKYVVDYLVSESHKIPSQELKRDGLLPLPIGDALPVIVAARMSLSFPGLFTLIPLFAANYEAEGNPLRQVWFSDGGITSNLPIHRFDALFPRWPTLGINLQYADAKGRIERAGIDENLTYMIKRHGDGTRDLWHDFAGADTSVGKLLGFAMGIFRSAQVWHDNSYLRLPGYRDRVVEIWLHSDEGGLNLDMPKPTIDKLVARGEAAGTRLCQRFNGQPAEDEVNWDGHRWTRLRSVMAGLATSLYRFKRSAQHPMPGDATLTDLLGSLDAPPYYRFSSAQHAAVKSTIEEIIKLVDHMQATAVCGKDEEQQSRPFCGGPRPSVEVGSRAPI